MHEVTFSRGNVAEYVYDVISGDIRIGFYQLTGSTTATLSGSGRVYIPDNWGNQSIEGTAAISGNRLTYTDNTGLLNITFYCACIWR